ncbi:unnamed protein product, partial [Cylicocyclus nassatus]
MGYRKVSEDRETVTLEKNDGPANPWGADIPHIYFASRTLKKVLNVKIYSPQRYDPPSDLFPNLMQPWKEDLQPMVENSLVLTTKEVNNVFSFAIKRASTQVTLFDSSHGPLIFSDKFLQLTILLPSEQMYGWGENVHETLKHDFSDYTTWAMFARNEDTGAESVSKRNLYGVHPFYMVVEEDGNAHGVLILNTNAQEITTAPGPALIYRTIGGNLNLFFFPGPTPEKVIQQYLEMIGKPFLPAYWAFGFQISRWGYKNISVVEKVIEKNIKAGVPLDVVVYDIDYMNERREFTLGKEFEGLPAYIRSQRANGLRSVLIFNPAIPVNHESFERALKAGARFVEWERKDQVMRSAQDRYPLVKDTKIMLGVTWANEYAAFPDFLDPNSSTADWYINEFTRFHEKVPYDGIWLSLNEPTSFYTNEHASSYFHSFHEDSKIMPIFCPKNADDQYSDWDVVLYSTHAVFLDERKLKNSWLASKTLCMVGMAGGGKQRLYNVKNLYGLSQAKVALQAQYKATKKRGFVVSRSTFVSNGQYSGHWLGDNTASWEDLRRAVIAVQEFNMFGIPFVGSDICGFKDDTTEELCLRWQQVGAFHPLMRNHNSFDSIPQDPAQWASVTFATIKANRFRYSYLPYLFSLHFKASLYGGTVVRPLFFEYPNDAGAHNAEYQFLWGRSLLIAPVVYEEENSVEAYVPEDDWYSLYDYKYGRRIDSGDQDLPAPWTFLIPVLVRGGSIIPRQRPENTTDRTRKNPFELLIAARETNGLANGFLYWDDGESIVESFKTHPYCSWLFLFSTNGTGATLVIDLQHKTELQVLPKLDLLEIFNYKDPPDFSTIYLNNVKVKLVNELSHYNGETKILIIKLKSGIDLTASDHMELSWKNK